MQFKIYFWDYILPLLFNIVNLGLCDDAPSCSVNKITRVCEGPHRICREDTQKCVCVSGYNLVRVNSETSPDGYMCVSSNLTTDTSSNHKTTVIIVALFTTCLVLCGLFLLVHRYKFMDYIRQKIMMRRHNEILYEDVMIGQDDPPITA